MNETVYTFSGWLRFIKKMSQDEIDSLWDDNEKWEKLQKEYEEYTNKVILRRKNE